MKKSFVLHLIQINILIGFITPVASLSAQENWPKRALRHVQSAGSTTVSEIRHGLPATRKAAITRAKKEYAHVTTGIQAAYKKLTRKKLTKAEADHLWSLEKRAIGLIILMATLGGGKFVYEHLKEKKDSPPVPQPLSDKRSSEIDVAPALIPEPATESKPEFSESSASEEESSEEESTSGGTSSLAGEEDRDPVSSRAPSFSSFSSSEEKFIADVASSGESESTSDYGLDRLYLSEEDRDPRSPSLGSESEEPTFGEEDYGPLPLLPLSITDNAPIPPKAAEEEQERKKRETLRKELEEETRAHEAEKKAYAQQLDSVIKTLEEESEKAKREERILEQRIATKKERARIAAEVAAAPLPDPFESSLFKSESGKDEAPSPNDTLREGLAQRRVALEDSQFESSMLGSHFDQSPADQGQAPMPKSLEEQKQDLENALADISGTGWRVENRKADIKRKIEKIKRDIAVRNLTKGREEEAKIRAKQEPEGSPVWTAVETGAGTKLEEELTKSWLE